MTERIPIRRATQLDSLNPEDTVEGYKSGYAGDPEPGNNHSFSFWHGWRNGRADKGLAPIDQAQRDLAHDVVSGAR